METWFRKWLERFIDNFRRSIIPEKALDIIVDNLGEDITFYDDIEEQLTYLKGELENDND